jgi:hypothetical protein
LSAVGAQASWLFNEFGFFEDIPQILDMKADPEND